MSYSRLDLFTQALDQIKKTLTSEPEMAYNFWCNLVMLAIDAGGDPMKSESQSRQFLINWIELDVSTLPWWEDRTRTAMYNPTEPGVDIAGMHFPSN